MMLGDSCKKCYKKQVEGSTKGKAGEGKWYKCCGTKKKKTLEQRERERREKKSSDGPFACCMAEAQDSDRMEKRQKSKEKRELQLEKTSTRILWEGCGKYFCSEHGHFMCVKGRDEDFELFNDKGYTLTYWHCKDRSCHAKYHRKENMLCCSKFLCLLFILIFIGAPLTMWFVYKNEVKSFLIGEIAGSDGEN